MPKRLPKTHYHVRCDCGRVAQYRLSVPILRPDLETEVRVVLHLCEDCFLLEQEIRSLDGRQPPTARRIA
jgi:hypothetical protein